MLLIAITSHNYSALETRMGVPFQVGEGGCCFWDLHIRSACSRIPSILCSLSVSSLSTVLGQTPGCRTRGQGGGIKWRDSFVEKHGYKREGRSGPGGMQPWGRIRLVVFLSFFPLIYIYWLKTSDGQEGMENQDFSEKRKEKEHVVYWDWQGRDGGAAKAVGYFSRGHEWQR